jgi:hypothetical protein
VFLDVSGCRHGADTRAGFGAKPALVVVDVNRGFSDPASLLVGDLDEVIVAIQRGSGGRDGP